MKSRLIAFVGNIPAYLDKLAIHVAGWAAACIVLMFCGCCLGGLGALVAFLTGQGPLMWQADVMLGVFVVFATLVGVMVVSLLRIVGVEVLWELKEWRNTRP
jgi:hypothetical protein